MRPATYFPLLLLKALLLCTSLSWIHLSHSEERAYTMGVVPQFEIRKIREIWQPILDDLHENTGIRLILLGSANIPAFEQELDRGSYDFAYMNPYHALKANEKTGYQALLRDLSRNLQGILVVNKNSAIQRVEDLAGQKIAFPAPNALGASLLMRAELERKFKIQFTPVYVKTHGSVYLNVLVNHTAAGGGVMRTFKQQPRGYQQALKILYRTTPVPSHPLMAHPRVPTEVVTAIQQGIIKLSQTKMGKQRINKIPMKQPGIVSSKEYETLRSLKLDDYYVH